MKRIGLLIGLFFIFGILLSSCGEEPQKSRKSLKGEKWYQSLWCDEQAGRAEVPMVDKTRCDCLTSAYAIEVDFGRKWAEAIGQSLHYSRLTGKDAGILLILKDASDRKYVSRLRDNIHYFDLPIRVWTIDAADYQKKSRGKSEESGSLRALKNFICKLAAFSSFVESYCY
jgi:hypothetical protein